MVWAILIVTVAIMIWLGFRSKTTADTEEGFLVAGRTLGPLVGGCTLIATFYSGYVFIGSPGVAYEYGYIEVLAEVLYLPPMFLAVLFFANFIKNRTQRFGSLTVPEYLGQLHGSKFVQLLVSILTLLLTMVFLISQMKAMAILMAPFLNITVPVAVVILGGVVIIYTVLGGMAAVAWTDTVQTFGMMIAALIVISVVFANTSIGDLTAALKSIDPNLVNPSTSDPFGSKNWSVFLFIPYSFIFLLATPYVTVRFMSVRKNIKWHKMALYILPFTAIWMTVPFAGLFVRTKFSNLAEPDTAMPVFLENFLPTMLLPVIVLFVLMAMQSSCDSVIHNMASIVSYDLRKIFFKNKVPAEKVMLINRTSVVVIGVLSIVFTIWMPPTFIIWLGILGVGTLQAALVGPLLVSNFWVGNKIGAVTSMIGGASLTGWALITSTLGWVEAPIAGAVLGTILYMAVSKLTFSIMPRQIPQGRDDEETATAPLLKADSVAK